MITLNVSLILLLNNLVKKERRSSFKFIKSGMAKKQRKFRNKTGM